MLPVQLRLRYKGDLGRLFSFWRVVFFGFGPAGLNMRMKNLKLIPLSVLLIFLSACSEASQPTAADQVELAATAETHGNDIPIATPIANAAPANQVITRRIAYGEIDARNLYGYLSVPEGATGSMPALIVIHEWWGLNENIIATSERLAAEGYVTLAVDLYGDKVAEAPKEAMKLMRGVMSEPDLAVDNLKQAYEYLVIDAAVSKVGVIGWCFGGRWSLQTALALPNDVDAMVMYYGSVEPDKARLATLSMPILGLFAGDDPIVRPNTVELFRKNLDDLGKTANVYIYEDSQHGFANPSGMAYDADAAQDAWQKTTDFFHEHLASIKD